MPTIIFRPLGMLPLKWKALLNLVIFLNTTYNLQQFRMFPEPWEQNFSLELKECLLIMRDQPYFWIWTLHRQHKNFETILYAFNSCYIFVIKLTFYTTLRDSDAVQFTFFLVMRLNIIIITGYGWFIGTLLHCFSSWKIEGLRMDWRNTSEMSIRIMDWLHFFDFL